MKVWIEFIKSWGHPTRNLICGVGSRWKVSEWAADNLERSGYARRVKQRGPFAARDAVSRVQPAPPAADSSVAQEE